MSQLTFQPGPSQLSLQTKQDIQDALDLNVGQMSHRSQEFTDLSAKTIKELRAFFEVPDDYTVLYVPSATDAMELLIRNLVHTSSFHFVNGVFSELFADIAERYGKTVTRDTATWGLQNNFKESPVPSSAEIITLSYCETTTGVMCTDDDIRLLRLRFPDPLLCIDVTSMAGMKRLPIADADAWFFSVQKGMGLLSGMGVLILSPRAVERSRTLRKAGLVHPGLWAFGDMSSLMASNSQTLNTPNTLAIYLLGRQLERWNAAGGIVPLEKRTKAKAEMLYAFIASNPALHCFAKDPLTRSTSVICIGAELSVVTLLLIKARDQGIYLGTGYGPLRGTTVRMANFPAHAEADMLRAIGFMAETLAPLPFTNRSAPRQAVASGN